MQLWSLHASTLRSIQLCWAYSRFDSGVKLVWCTSILLQWSCFFHKQLDHLLFACRQPPLLLLPVRIHMPWCQRNEHPDAGKWFGWLSGGFDFQQCLSLFATHIVQQQAGQEMAKISWLRWRMWAGFFVGSGYQRVWAGFVLGSNFAHDDDDCVGDGMIIFRLIGRSTAVVVRWD